MFPRTVFGCDNGPGPGQILYKARLNFGTTINEGAVWDSDDVPVFNDPTWTARRWAELGLDSYDVTTAGFYDAVSVIKIGSAGGADAAQHTSLLVPCAGYSHLLLEVDGISAVTDFGVLWRGNSKEGVI